MRSIGIGVATVLLSISACTSKSNFGNGFETIDGGGSKISLSRDGIIIISYTVTGEGMFGPYAIIENRPYNSLMCEYYIIDNKRQLVRLGHSEGQMPSAAQAARTIIPLNNRSCMRG